MHNGDRGDATTPGASCRALGLGIHVNPEVLKRVLQEADMSLLDYGLCFQAVVGLRANGCMLVVPAVNDCVAIARGSRGAYETQRHIEPDTYYLTESWIGPGDGPFDACDDPVERNGEGKAQWLKG